MTAPTLRRPLPKSCEEVAHAIDDAAHLITRTYPPGEAGRDRLAFDLAATAATANAHRAIREHHELAALAYFEDFPGMLA